MTRPTSWTVAALVIALAAGAAARLALAVVHRTGDAATGPTSDHAEARARLEVLRSGARGSGESPGARPGTGGRASPTEVPGAGRPGSGEAGPGPETHAAPAAVLGAAGGEPELPRGQPSQAVRDGSSHTPHGGPVLAAVLGTEASRSLAAGFVSDGADGVVLESMFSVQRRYAEANRAVRVPPGARPFLAVCIRNGESFRTITGMEAAGTDGDYTKGRLLDIAISAAGNPALREDPRFQEHVTQGWATARRTRRELREQMWSHVDAAIRGGRAYIPRTAEITAVVVAGGRIRAVPRGANPALDEVANRLVALDAEVESAIAAALDAH